MRFTSRVPQEGNLRVRTFFAWLPVRVVYPDFTTETRWLERVCVEQRYVTRCKGPCHWSDIGFIDDIEGRGR